MKSTNGFSLIELVVVIVISAMLAAIAIPRFTDPESREAGYHQQVKAGVRYAQRQAIAHRRCVFVVVGAAQIDLFYDNGSCPTAGPALTNVATGNAYSLPAPPGVVLSPTMTFSFDGLGRPSPIAGVTFSVGGHLVTVTAETGYVP